MTATATQLPIGTRVRIVGFGACYQGLTGVVTSHDGSGFYGWTFVALDRRATADEVDLGFPADCLEALPEPTVSLVKVAPVADRIAELEAALADEVAAHASTQALANARAAWITHLEEMVVRGDQVMADQARLIRDQKAERDQLRDQLERVSDAAVDKAGRVAELEAEAAELRAALRQAQDRAQTASDAAEEYRTELMDARRLLDNIAALAERPRD
jgi:cell division septum initiation protein DivIVA